MRLPIDRSRNGLPQRLPVGATYVVEGYGGEAGQFRVIARYVVLPGGRRINVPPDLAPPAPPRALPFRRRPDSKRYSRKSGPKQHPRQTGKKIAGRRGTA
jgi:hypothetical protein